MKYSIILIVLFAFYNSKAQTNFNKKDYKEGLYKTIDDLMDLKSSQLTVTVETRQYDPKSRTFFICKSKNNSSISSKVKLRHNQSVKYIDEPEGRVLFYNAATGKIIKKTAAIFFNNNLYINVETYYKNLTRKNRATLRPESARYFIKVLDYGKWLYMEDVLKSGIKQGLGYGGGLIGGAIGGAMAASDKGSSKTIVFDKKTKKFTLLTSCEEVNDFLKVNKVMDITCTKKDIRSFEIKSIISRVNRAN